MDAIVLVFVSTVAGFIGSLLGLGGGIIVIPILTLVYHVDIRYAIAASLISIIATSSGAAAGFIRDRLTNLRLAVVLEVGTVLGAMVGFFVSRYANPSILFLLFGSFLFFSAVMMLRKKGDTVSQIDHPWSTSLKLAHEYKNDHGVMIQYKVENVPLGLLSMFLAGILSAILGIGSGIFKVMAMDGFMKIPLKVSSATSNFMIGVTASASASAYFLRGDIRPEIACPVSLGIIIGAWVGGILMPKIPTQIIRKLFVVLLSIVSIDRKSVV